MDIIARVKGILLSPKTEWPVIAAEQTDIKQLFLGYGLILAAIPAAVSLIVFLLAGLPVNGITGALTVLIGYVIGVLLIAKLIEIVAPKFGYEISFISAAKYLVYAGTPGMLAAIFGLLGIISLGAIGSLIQLVASVYGLYLLYLGWPVMAKKIG